MPSSSFYNTIAYVYDTYCETSQINTYLEKELAILEQYSPSSVLEFGIGTGRFAQAFLKRNPDTFYVGVDNSEEMLAHAHDSGATRICDDIRNYLRQIIQEKKTFDCIVAPYTALHHIPTHEQPKLLEDMKKVTHTVILNCLSKYTEKELLGERKEVEVTFMLPDNKSVQTTIHAIHEELRRDLMNIEESKDRVYLVYLS
jgi:ubiquinone/menaquinone biosynthesis C-methylase UbiE